jgi:hypothetical protein
VKWLIADRIAAKPELNFDPAKGPVRLPWIAWGSYLWAHGGAEMPIGAVRRG